MRKQYGYRRALAECVFVVYTSMNIWEKTEAVQQFYVSFKQPTDAGLAHPKHVRPNIYLHNAVCHPRAYVVLFIIIDQ